MLQALEKNPGYICVLRQFDENLEFENQIELSKINQFRLDSKYLQKFQRQALIREYPHFINDKIPFFLNFSGSLTYRKLHYVSNFERYYISREQQERLTGQLQKKTAY